MIRLLVPDLALAGAMFAVLYCLLLFDGGRKLFRDGDTGWHIRTGERILTRGELPRADPYSWSRHGEPWVAWEWLADVAMGAVHQRAGLSGVALLYLAAIGASVWLWFRLTWAVGGDFLLACLLVSPLLSTVHLHWLARPHLLGWVWLLVWVLICEGAARLPRMRLWIATALLAMLWANTHASFFLQAAIAIVYAIGALIERVVWGRDKAAGRFLEVAVISAAASFVNPYGWSLHVHVGRYLSDSALLQRIGEFQTFNFQAEGAPQILLALAVAMAASGIAWTQGRAAHGILLAGFSILALRSARGLPILALMLPLANGAIVSAALGAQGSAPRVRAALHGLLRYSGNLLNLDRRLGGVAAIPIAIAIVWGLLRLPPIAARVGFPPGEFPVSASEAVDRLPANARLLHPDKFGGYLIYRFNGARPVFFDGRSDFYGLAFMKQYIALAQARPGWPDTLARWRPTHALLGPDYPLLDALKTTGWTEVYRDPVAVMVQAPER